MAAIFSIACQLPLLSGTAQRSRSISRFELIAQRLHLPDLFGGQQLDPCVARH